MNEQIVAIGGPGLYPEYKGYKSMVDRREKEEDKPNGERGRRHEAEGRARAKRGEEERKKRVEELRRKEAESPEVPEPSGKPQEIPFRVARKVVEVVGAIQDEKGVMVSGRELDDFKRILAKYGGYTDKAVSGMTDFQIVVVAQAVLRYNSVAEPAANEDWEYPVGDVRQKEEEKLAREIIAHARSKGEETLTVQKVGDYLHVEEQIEGVSRSTGPGTTGPTRWWEDLPDEVALTGKAARYVRTIRSIAGEARSDESKMRRLEQIEEAIDKDVLDGVLDDTDADVARIRAAVAAGQSELARTLVRARETGAQARGTEPTFEEPTRNTVSDLMEMVRDGRASGPVWEAKITELRARAERVASYVVDREYPKGYKEAFYTAKAARDALKIYGDNLPNEVRAQLNTIADQLKDLGKNFQWKFNQLNDKDQSELVGDIDREATTFFRQLTGGYGQGLEYAKNYLSGMVGEDQTGLREWRVFREMQALDDAVRVNQLTETPVIPEEIPQRLANLYSFIEGTDLGVEELQSTIQKMLTMVQQVPPTSREERERRERLIKEIESFRAHHIMRITLERNDMNPQQLIDVFKNYFEGKKEEALGDFIVRFERDSRGRKFLVMRDAQDHEIADLKEREVNLFDISFELYSTQLRDERIKMNMIEAMTMHQISVEFTPSIIEDIKRRVGLKDSKGNWSDISPITEEQFEAQLEELRKYFSDKLESEIVKNTGIDSEGKEKKWGSTRLFIDEAWGRKRKIKDTDGITVTKELIGEWHQKRTLQGAFGVVKEEDLKEPEDLLRQLITDIEAVNPPRDNVEAQRRSDAIRERLKKFVGKSFLDLRREVLLIKLEERLGRQGLNVLGRDPAGNESLREVDLKELRDSGFLESVDANAYFFAWWMEWSNYDNIRIYSRDTKSYLDDQYESVVYHQSTNMFYARHIDHIWEFFHRKNENRGRAMPNDVNSVWMQNFPGKHHYIFPQNTVAVRWADHFMAPQQKEVLTKRIKDLMKKHDFDNGPYHAEFESWMKSVAVMDMVENGEFTPGHDKVKFSDIIRDKKIKKFELIDLFADRTADLKYVNPENLQYYLANPTTAKFKELGDKVKGFYSTRDARLFPYMTLAWRSHWEVQSRHLLRLFNKPNMSSAMGERDLDSFVSEGIMERGQAEYEKRKSLGFGQIGGRLKIGELVLDEKEHYLPLPAPIEHLLGTGFFRKTRQTLELARRGLWDGKTLPFGFGLVLIWSIITQFFKQTEKDVTEGK